MGTKTLELADRFNSGKPRMDLIPVDFWIHKWQHELIERKKLQAILLTLAEWQEGKLTYPLTELLGVQEDKDLMDSVTALEFGAKKYSDWNWAKGMPWSVPLACILRHSREMVLGEPLDSESGLTHYSHILANLIMLAWFEVHYPQGDDRPPMQDLDP